MTDRQKIGYLVSVAIPERITPGMDDMARMRLWWWAMGQATVEGIVLMDGESDRMYAACGLGHLSDRESDRLFAVVICECYPGLKLEHE